MAAKRKPGEHNFVDDGLRAGGRAWQHGVRFVCTICGLDRRKIEEGQDRYYKGRIAVKGNIECHK